ncbi:unnamed protein product [Linum trigynum]|uniref:Peptidase C1A papain C-terminal domain-containing protein n=1 Tax=Linum trigynum TaxID=586398 RepID=A0AAV2DS29_9ROSI
MIRQNLPRSSPVKLFMIVTSVFCFELLGICWAISVASAVEAVMNLHRAEDDDTQWMTSSQELMDWVQSDLDNIKNSGLRRMYNVWNHVFKKKVSKEENYKYVGEPALEKERFALGVTIPERVVLRISGFEVIEPVDDERLLLRQLATMPVVASLEATPSFLDWKGQTIFTRDTETTEDQKTRRDKKVELHSILVVGVTRRLNYFLIRNSYGKDWVFKIRGADRRWTAKGLGKVLRASSRSSRQSLFTSFSYPKPWVPP